MQIANTFLGPEYEEHSHNEDSNLERYEGGNLERYEGTYSFVVQILVNTDSDRKSQKSEPAMRLSKMKEEEASEAYENR